MSRDDDTKVNVLEQSLPATCRVGVGVGVGVRVGVGIRVGAGHRRARVPGRVGSEYCDTSDVFKADP